MSFKKLQEAIDKLRSPVVVGLDPTPQLLPPRYGKTPEDMSEAYSEFCKTIIDAVSGVVPAVKPQAAFFEALPHGMGLSVLYGIARYAKSSGLYVILDCKRGDIGSTAEAYANAYLSIDSPFDAITINGYTGSDGIIPFRDAALNNDKAVFTLVKTSNKSSGDIQDLDTGGDTVYEKMARLISTLNCGSGDDAALGAVVGATYPEQAVRLREILPGEFFLIPGYGAQGGSAEDAAAGFTKEGRAIVNSSRGIIGAWQKTGNNGEDFADAARNAAINMRGDLRAALGI